MFTTTEKWQAYNSLSLKLEKIHTMKWLLDLENEDWEVTENDLQKQIDGIAKKNFTYLTMINFYLAQCPDEVKKTMEKLSATVNNKILYQKAIDGFKNQFATNSIFKEFEQFLLTKIATDALLDVGEKDWKNEQILTAKMLETKRKYFILLFNILSEEINDTIKFDTSEIIYNFLPLSMWVKKNKFKPIEKLSNDDCEVLAGLYYGFDYDEIFKLNLSSFVRDYQSINSIIENLPAKFHVQNLSQVIFRLFLLKPFLWSQTSHEKIVTSISEIHNAL